MEKERRYYTEAVARAAKKYRKENYSQLTIYVKKENKDAIKARAQYKRMSLNSYIISLIENDMSEGKSDNKDECCYIPKLNKTNLGKYIKSFFPNYWDTHILAKTVILEADEETAAALSYLASVTGKTEEDVLSAFNGLYNDDPAVGDYDRKVWLGCFEAAGGSEEKLMELIEKSREKAQGFVDIFKKPAK